MNKTILGTGALFGLLAVIFGALGAHGLKNLLPESSLGSFQTGVAYQMYHALFLLVLGTMNQLEEKAKKSVFYLIAGGVLCFSFSIYALSTGPLLGLDFSAIGWITPVGGILLIAGWTLFIYRVFRGLN
ncbi:DUF423 domain-containing protein [Robiginitalea aurantiaca]|uniref:DUF423 domain-containing protein n=1 Tax=Robiginitalea aurantiaca TaxID=3056915 RepID=A0ABT7WEY1_9FLAO|nr:DUF423 domain-containing protein [Robiginitalea aurantiaca]MDM9631374.1 DUF423 domain-containing protein [Robiginitalea aurantiaca]